MHKPWIFICCYLARVGATISTCKCKSMPLHEAYCQSDFVILAEIATPMRMPDISQHVLTFEANTRRIFRQKNNLFQVGNRTTVFTPRTISMCHAHVKRRELYLLGGTIKRKNVYITSCDLVKKWSELNGFVRKSLRKGKLSCECAVRGCHGSQCVPRIGKKETNSCEKSSVFVSQCYEEFGICSFQGKTCRWSKLSAPRLRKCLQIDTPILTYRKPKDA